MASALTAPLSVDLLTVSGRSAFAAVPTQTPTAPTGATPTPLTPTPATPGAPSPAGTPGAPLPRTGTDNALILAAGMLAAGTAFGLRRVLRTVS